MQAIPLFGSGVLLLSLNLVAFGLEQPPSQEARVAARIAEISRRLAPEALKGLSIDEADAQRANATAAIRAEVTEFVESHIRPSQGQESILARLRVVLVDHRPHLEHAEPPTVRTADLRFGRSLVLSYTVDRPPHFDEGRLFGFRAEGERYRLMSTAGDDYEGFSMSTHLLPSPSPRELWLLTLGQAHTFNGAKIRFRVYSFDGQEFRTIWTPEDLLSAKVEITAAGFIIRHIPRDFNDYVLEEYTVSPGAILRVR